MVSQRRNRRGSSTVGCLVSLVIFVATIYYGTAIGTHYWRYYQLLDEMRTQATLAPSLTDPVIRRRLVSKVDELGLPAEARRFRITRSGSPRVMIIETEYADSVKLPLFRHTFVFTPRAEEPL
ncbi:MAG: hypothetical protein H0U85_01490 [Gemmatimonadales bacterium]|nr:hypothetical protein [Gemmatimonadales bacterium]